MHTPRTPTAFTHTMIPWNYALLYSWVLHFIWSQVFSLEPKISIKYSIFNFTRMASVAIDPDKFGSQNNCHRWQFTPIAEMITVLAFIHKACCFISLLYSQIFRLSRKKVRWCLLNATMYLKCQVGWVNVFTFFTN